MTASIAWIAAPSVKRGLEDPAAVSRAATPAPHPPAGCWGDPGDLTLPVNDRGLLLGDGLFETLLLEEGRLRLLAEHLERWRHSADLLGMAAPPTASWIVPLVAEAMDRSGIRTGALRLNWSRGSGGRGLDIPTPGNDPSSHRFWLQLSASTPRFDGVSTWISRQERRNAASRLSRCKSFAYGSQLQARREARAAGAEDALLLSSTGELCCGSSANLLVRLRGRWLTPPLASGCLPGVMRGRALRLGVAEEGLLAAGALEECEGAVLINSLGCRPILCCDGCLLPPMAARQAERLWRDLLEEGAA